MPVATRTCALLGALTLLAGAGAPAPLAAAEQRFSPGEGGLIEFMMPSRNIGCVYLPQGDGRVLPQRDAGPVLVCDRVEPGYVILALAPEGIPVVIGAPDDPDCCSGQIFDYGNTWREGPFLCASETTGLTCRSDDGGGFSLARARIELF